MSGEHALLGHAVKLIELFGNGPPKWTCQIGELATLRDTERFVRVRKRYFLIKLRPVHR